MSLALYSMISPTSKLVIASIGTLGVAIYWAYVNTTETLLNRIGFVGSLASIWGIAFTWLQVIEAKKIAAEARDASAAAREATEETSRELRNNYYRFSLFTARRLISEIRSHVIGLNWPIAAVRADDLGEHASQLAHLRPTLDHEWIYVRTALHAWAIVFRSGKLRRRLTHDEAEWAELCIRISDKIDRESDPLE